MGVRRWGRCKEKKIGNPLRKAIYLYLATCENDGSGQCNPSQERIAADLEMSLNSVRQHIRGLIADGLIERSVERSGYRVDGASYRFLDGARGEPSEDKSMVQEVNHQIQVHGATGDGSNGDGSRGDISNDDTSMVQMTIAHIKEGTEENRSNIPKLSDSDADKVFNFWVQIFSKTGNVRFGKKRKANVKARLKEGYTVEDLHQAILGCSVTPHNRGENEDGKEWTDLELICRTETHVERFRDNWNRHAHKPDQQADVCDRCKGGDAPGKIWDSEARSYRSCDHRSTAQESNVVPINRTEELRQAVA